NTAAGSRRSSRRRCIQAMPAAWPASSQRRSGAGSSGSAGASPTSGTPTARGSPHAVLAHPALAEAVERRRSGAGADGGLGGGELGDVVERRQAAQAPRRQEREVAPEGAQ